MRAAKTIRDLPNSLIPNYPLEQDRDEEFYVPIYEEEIEKLRDEILYDELHTQTRFVSGQTGTGKTTALHFLPDKYIKAEYDIIFLNAKDLFELSDVTIIEVLLMICYQLIEADGSNTLAKEFQEQIENLEKSNKGILDQVTVSDTGVEGELGGGIEAELGGNPIARLLSLFKLKGNFFANLRLDRSYRKITREAFAFNKLELRNITNRIIDRYLDLSPTQQKLLLILNELDHMKDPKLIYDLFVQNRQLIKDLTCKKVISVPVSLIAEEEFMEEIAFFCIKLLPNPIKHHQEDEMLIQQNQQLLAEIVSKRIAHTELIQEGSIEQAIKASGGILRQYITILHEAAKHARRKKGEQLHDFNVEEGIRVFRQILERSVVLSMEKIHILEDVRIQNQSQASGKQAFNECLLGNQILVYNNDPTWYRVNPLIEETVELYARRSQTN